MAAARVEGGEGVGEAQEVGAAILLGLQQVSQRLAASRRLQEHGGVDAVQRGGTRDGAEFVGDGGAARRAADATVP